MRDVAVPRELPPAPADLAGRDEECALAAEHLTRAPGGDTGPRVWVATGPPGAGKSTLALHVAHRVAGRFPDGQLYLPMTDATAEGADAVLAALRRALTTWGVAAPALAHDVPGLAAQLRTRLADARVLIVLDDVPGGVDLSPLLPAGGACAVIVTARIAPLSLPTARHQVLGPLPEAGALTMLTALAGSERVLAEPAAASAVAALCERLPVALQVAGSRLATRPTLTLAELAARLQDERSRLDLLSAGDLGVRTSLASAYQALGAADREVLHVLGDLGVPAGPTWAVAAALGLDQATAVARVERLVDAGLVGSHGAGGTHGYTIYDLTRLVAGERSAEAEGARRRGERLAAVLDRLRELAEAATARLPIVADRALDLPSPARPATTAELDAVLVDPRRWVATAMPLLVACAGAALDLAPTARVWPALTAMLAYWRSADVIVEHASLLEEVARRTAAEGDRRGEALALLLLGFDPYGDRPAELSSSRLRRAAELFADLGEVPGQGRALSLLALVDGSLPTVRSAVELTSDHPDPHVAGDPVATWARLALISGDLDEAARAVARARSRFAEPPSPQWLAQVDWVEGALLRRRGDPARAREVLDRAAAFVASFGDRWGMVVIGDELAEVALAEGRTDDARTGLHRAAGRARTIGLTAMAERLQGRLTELATPAGAPTES